MAGIPRDRGLDVGLIVRVTEHLCVLAIFVNNLGRGVDIAVRDWQKLEDGPILAAHDHTLLKRSSVLSENAYSHSQ